MHPCPALPPALRVSTRASILLAMYQGPCAQIVLVLLLPIACAAPGRLEPFALPLAREAPESEEIRPACLRAACCLHQVSLLALRDAAAWPQELNGSE